MSKLVAFYNKLCASLTQNNTVTALLVIFVGVGLGKLIVGQLTFPHLVNLLDVQIAAYGIGAGLATIKFKKAVPGEPLLGFLSILVVGAAIIMGVQVLLDSLTYEAYLNDMAAPFAGLAIGKGLFAHNSTR